MGCMTKESRTNYISLHLFFLNLPNFENYSLMMCAIRFRWEPESKKDKKITGCLDRLIYLKNI